VWEHSSESPREGYPYFIYLFDLETGSFDFLAEGEGPVWSPGGWQIAYFRQGLWVIDLSTGEEQLLFPSEQGQQRHAHWSPDGGRIIFHNYPDGFYGTPEIVMVDAGGTTPPIYLIEQSEYYIDWVRWFPGGNQILYDRADYSPTGSELVTYLWSLIPESGERRVWFAPNQLLIAPPQWSPDGKWLLFSAISVYEVLEGQSSFYDLWVVGADDSGLRRLTLDVVREWNPQWSPDGTEVIFQKQGQGTWALNLATGQIRQIWSGEAGFFVVP
jgi:Tol biopolymer transport system component